LTFGAGSFAEILSKLPQFAGRLPTLPAFSSDGWIDRPGIEVVGVEVSPLDAYDLVVRIVVDRPETVALRQGKRLTRQHAA
jgi:hypothetical protein